MRTFTDDEGNKFEAVPPTNYYLDRNAYVIKPVKAVEKKSYWIYLEASNRTLMRKDLELTEPTAQKVAEAVEALMLFIQGDSKDNGQWPAVVSEARVAFREDA